MVAIAQDPPARSRPRTRSDDLAPDAKRARRAIVWETDERAARARAQREGALLMVHLAAAWSAGSLAMEREVWSDPRIAFYPGPLVALRIDLTDAGPNAELWADRYGARAVPTTLLLDLRGRAREREREVGRLEGPVSADEVLRALESAAGEGR